MKMSDTWEGKDHAIDFSDVSTEDLENLMSWLNVYLTINR
jgi:hypothetical protein